MGIQRFRSEYGKRVLESSERSKFHGSQPNQHQPYAVPQNTESLLRAHEHRTIEIGELQIDASNRYIR